MAFDISKFAADVPSMGPRTIETVTAEILDIKQRWAEDFISLGRRLCEAKELLDHGEWLPWLEQRVQFSERTAQKFMQISRAYENNATLALDLGSEKAFALLALPEEAREDILQNGATVNGKTKAASDLTTREVKQIVAERKTTDFHQKATDYLLERANEDERYRMLLQGDGDWLRFAESISMAGNRQAGIEILKHRWRNSGGTYMRGGYTGSPKGLRLHGEDHVYIERTWTEVWDMLAVMALQEAGKKPQQAEPEGQLVIAGYMPAGTNPGRESGLCVCMMQLDPEKEPAPMLLYWDGAKCEWQFKHGAAVEQEPVGWMRLPEWRN